MADVVTREDVLARWVYSELSSLESGNRYVGVDDLREKESQNVPYHELEPQERALLLRKWHEVRGAEIFTAALDGVTHFQVEDWTKARLGSAYILPHFHEWLGAEYAVGETTFKDWIEAGPPPGELEPRNRSIKRESNDPRGN